MISSAQVLYNSSHAAESAGSTSGTSPMPCSKMPGSVKISLICSVVEAASGVSSVEERHSDPTSVLTIKEYLEYVDAVYDVIQLDQEPTTESTAYQHTSLCPLAYR